MGKAVLKLHIIINSRLKADQYPFACGDPTVPVHYTCKHLTTLKVLVATIDALGHFETG